MKTRDFDVLKDYNVLYLEDEDDLRKHTTTVLEDFFHKIFPVSNAVKAMEVMRTNQIDIIVTDIQLRQGNGIDFIGEIREEYGYLIPIVLTTGHTDTEYLLDAIKLKIENYIVKPINIKELLNSLHDALLPRIQEREISRNYMIIKTIATVTDGKQVELIRFIIRNLDDENVLNYSYTDIMEEVDVSKPTIIKLFKQLSDQGVLIKIQNGRYRFDPNRLPMPE